MSKPQRRIFGLMIIGVLFASIAVLPLFTFSSVSSSTYRDQDFSLEVQEGDKKNKVELPGVNASYEKGLAILEGEVLTVKVAGKQVPHFQFWPTEDNTTVYHAKFVHLAEYNDTNGDNAFQYNETIKTKVQGAKIFAFPSVAPSWEFSGFYNVTRDDEIIGFGFNFSMSLTSDPLWGNLTVNITNRFYLETVEETLKAGDEAATYNVSGLAALKTNIWVQNWSFEDPTTQLALRWDISQSGEETPSQLSGKPVDFGKEMEQGKEKPVEPSKDKSVSVAFNASQHANATFKVPTVAKIKEETGEKLVESSISYRTDGKSLRMFMSAPATNGTVIYDPITETSIEEDTTDPEITITEPTEGTIFHQNDFTISWSGTDEGSGIDHYEIKLDDGTWIPVGTSTSYEFTDVEDGDHTVQVKAVDVAGNPAVDSVSFTVSTEEAEPGLPMQTLAIIGVAVIVVLAVAGYLLKKR